MLCYRLCVLRKEGGSRVRTRKLFHGLFGIWAARRGNDTKTLEMNRTAVGKGEVITNSSLLKAEQKSQTWKKNQRLTSYTRIRNLQNGSPAISMKSYIWSYIMFSVSCLRGQEAMYNISGNFLHICSNFWRVLVFRKSFLQNSFTWSSSFSGIWDAVGSFGPVN